MIALPRGRHPILLAGLLGSAALWAAADANAQMPTAMPSGSAPAPVAVVLPTAPTARAARPPQYHRRVTRHHAGHGHRATGRTQRSNPVTEANAAARIQPDRASWLNAIQQYTYADGALYQVYAAPGEVTDIALEAGENLAGNGPVASGDTVRWIIGDTMSGTGADKRIHILVKPTRGDIMTNLVINTDRRTYHLELRATPATYMAAVSWTYPADSLIALHAAQAEQQRLAPVAAGVDLAALNFRYRIDGDKPAWRPSRVFDDGRQAFIEFPEGIATGEMPPLFVTDSDGATELVNYRVQGRYMVVDRLFNAAQLRLGTKKSETVVRITREGAGKGKRS